MTAVFTENWFTDQSCASLAALVRSVEGVPGRIVELGSWEGRSTIAIADATNRQIHAVDHWNGAESDTYQREQVKERDVYARWKSNLAGRSNVVGFRMDWRVYHALNGAPADVALVFIDADHTTAEVSAQIDAFRPLMVSGGIICGDDYPLRPVSRAVRNRLRTGVTVDGRVWSWRAP